MSLKKLTQILSKDYASMRVFLDVNRTYGLSAVYIKDLMINETLSKGIKEQIHPKKMFQAASISKSIFAATVMRLYEKEYIDIDQDIASYLGSFTYQTYDNMAHVVTLRDLLTHTAGFNIHGFAGYLHNQILPSVEEMLKGVRPSHSLEVKMTKPPKSEFTYSGGGFMLAQYVLEQVTKKSYQAWAEELIFKPLNMLSSTLSVPLSKALQTHAAIGYSSHDTKLDHGHVIYPELAAAGLWTTPTDLARFGIEMMKAYQGVSTWLSQSSAKTMMTIPKDITSEYGLGFQIKKLNKSFLFGHGGNNTGFHSVMAFNPQNGEGIVVMVNSDIGDDIPRQILKLFITSQT